LLTAYQTGQLLNELDWHMQQAVILGRGYHWKRVIEILTDLLPAVTCMAVSLDTSQLLKQTVAECSESWQNLFQTEDFWEQYSITTEDLSPGDVYAPEDKLGPLVDWVRPIQARLRQSIQAQLLEYSMLRVALDMGEIVDQGIRPPKVYLRLLELRQDPLPGQPPSTTSSFPHINAPYIPCPQIARVSREPGELAPSLLWPGEITASWQLVGVTTELPQAVRTRQLPTTPTERLDLVKQLDQAVRDHVASVDGRQRAAVGAEPDTLTKLPGSQSGDGITEVVEGLVAQVGSNTGQTRQHAQTLPVSSAEFQRLLKLKKRIDPNDVYIGNSLPLLRVFEKIDEFNRSSDAPILILGPSGSGKTEIAQLIHQSSGRREKPFHREQAADNRAADWGLVKARWVGHGKNSGLANVPKDGSPGLLTGVTGGTIFIDELAELSLDFQTFLLDVLDRKPIPPTSGIGAPFTFNVRLLFATNADIADCEEAGKLKHDFLRRIRQRLLNIPPLAERKSDIFHFVSVWCFGCKPTMKFLLGLLRYSWPGNIGELRDILRLAVDKARAKELLLSHLQLPDAVVDAVKAIDDKDAERQVLTSLRSTLQHEGFEKGKGLQDRMARVLGLSAATVSRRLDSLELPDVNS